MKYYNVTIQNKAKMNYNFKIEANNKNEAIGKAFCCYPHLRLKVLNVNEITKRECFND